MRRRVRPRRGLAEIVGTIILVAIVVAAAAAFSLFVADYQSQLQQEEKATHDRNLEAVRILGASLVSSLELSVTLASGDTNWMNLTDYSIDGVFVSQWVFDVQGGSGSRGPCTFPASEMCDALSPLTQATVNLTSAGPINSPIVLGVFTARSNEFTYTFVPPVAIAKVSFVETGAGRSVPVFDGSASFQRSEPDNATIASFGWTIAPEHLLPTGVAYDSVQHTLLVTEDTYNQLDIVNESDNSIVSNVSVGTSPLGVAYDSSTGQIFVANSGSANVTVISDVTGKVVKNVPVGDTPSGVAYDAGTHQVYVTNSGSANVTVISDATDAVVVGGIPVGTNPSGVAYDSNSNQIFVANSGSANMTVISDSTHTVMDAGIPVGTSPSGVAFDPSTDQLFVVNGGSNSVSVISDSADTVVATVPVGPAPSEVAYDASTHQMLVTNSGLSNVSVIDDAGPMADKVVENPPVGPGPAGIAFDPSKGPAGETFIAARGGGSLAVLNGTTAPATLNDALRYLAVGEQVEVAWLRSSEACSVTLQVVNTDGLADTTSITFTQP